MPVPAGGNLLHLQQRLLRSPAQHFRDGLVHERLPHEHAKPRTRGGCKGAVSRLGKGRSEDDRCGRTAGKHTAEEELRLPFGKACIGVALLQWQNELLQPLQELPPLQRECLVLRQVRVHIHQPRQGNAVRTEIRCRELTEPLAGFGIGANEAEPPLPVNADDRRGEAAHLPLRDRRQEQPCAVELELIPHRCAVGIDLEVVAAEQLLLQLICSCGDSLNRRIQDCGIRIGADLRAEDHQGRALFFRCRPIADPVPRFSSSRRRANEAESGLVLLYAGDQTRRTSAPAISRVLEAIQTSCVRLSSRKRTVTA
jgi:hypothetical protein